VESLPSSSGTEQTCRSKTWKTLVSFYLSTFGQIPTPANMENANFWTLAGRPDARISTGSSMAQSNGAAVEKYTSERSTKNCR
jgi:hypothetical protein